jgi:hypothetical protein
LSAAFLVKVWNPRRRTLERIGSESSRPAVANPIAKAATIVGRATQERVNKLIVYEYPFVSTYLAFLTGTATFVAMPFLSDGGTVGLAIASWLAASARDANLPMPLEDWFSWAVTIVVWLFLVGTFSPLAVRLSAFYQLFLQKLALSNAGGGIAEALTEAVRTRRVKIKLAPSHPILLNIGESLGWIALCYITLFSIIAFMPGAVGVAIVGFLNGAIFETGLVNYFPLGCFIVDGSGDLVPYIDPQLRIFLASIVAAYGTAPFGMMACGFLPNRRPKHLFISPQGILVPHGFAEIALTPLIPWSDLKHIKLIGAGKRRRDQSIEITFENTVKFRIPLRLLTPEQTAELFTAIDEFADNCQMEGSTSALRTEIAAECPPLLAQQKTFITAARL